MGIVGPTLSRETHLIADFAISYAATDRDLSDRATHLGLRALHRRSVRADLLTQAIAATARTAAWATDNGMEFIVVLKYVDGGVRDGCNRLARPFAAYASDRRVRKCDDRTRWSHGWLTRSSLGTNGIHS